MHPRSNDRPIHEQQPHGSASGYVETHISRLFFTPDRVFKILKPVDTTFVSFASTEDRLAGIEAEFYLNSRVSPDVYLGVSDIVENDEVADRMLVMKRLPAHRQLSVLLTGEATKGSGVPSPLDLQQCLRDAARRIAAFHADQSPIRGPVAEPAGAAAMAANWKDGFDNLAPLTRPGSRIDGGALIDPAADDELQDLVENYLRGREQLFAQRQQQGRVIDGHGDLRADHIFCLDDGVRIIDCIAFRDDYRIVDVLNDVAFLAMDIHRLAGRELAAYFINAYDEFSNEHHPSTLAHFYVAYRAHIRAKVAAVRLTQGDSAAEQEVSRYHELALEHMRAARVRMVLVGGGAGVGKSTVAEGLAEGLRAVWLRSDEIRKAMGGLKADDHAYAQPDEGLYRPEMSDRVYTEMLRQAKELLIRGQNVVLDATWSKTRHRTEARTSAAEAGANLTELCCHAPLGVAKERITRRAAAVYNPSDATVETADYLAANFDPWPQSLGVNTAGSMAEARAIALDRVVGGTAEESLRSRRFTDDGPGSSPVVLDGAQILKSESITLFFSTRSSLSLTSVLLDTQVDDDQPKTKPAF